MVDGDGDRVQNQARLPGKTTSKPLSKYALSFLLGDARHREVPAGHRWILRPRTSDLYKLEADFL